MFSRKVLGLMTFAFAIAALTAPSTAHASKARAEALHVPAQYGVDRVNVQHFPTALYRNQNMIFGELGVWDNSSDSEFNDPESPSELGDADRSLGMYLGNLWEGRAGVFGIELNENGGPLSPTHGSEFVNRGMNESIALFWAQQFSGFTLGLEFNRMYSKFEDKSAGSEGIVAPYDWFGPSFPSASGDDTWEIFADAASSFGAGPWNSTGFGGGVAFENSDNTNMFELSIEARKYALEVSGVGSGFGLTADESINDDNGISFAANGRAMMQANQSLTWVPYVGFATTDLGYAYMDAATPANDLQAENKMTNFEAGIAGNWTLRQNDLLIAGAAFKSSELDWKDPISGADTLTFTLSQPLCLFAGFEGNLARWITIRFGASKPVFSTLKFEDPDDEVTLSDSPFNFALGTGFHFGNVHVDAVWNQDYTFSGGPLATSGFDSNVYPFSRLSVTYRY